MKKTKSSQKNPNNWLDKLGDFNPQLFREIKGRLTSINLTFAIVGGGLVNLIFFALLAQSTREVSGTSIYCALPPGAAQDQNLFTCPNAYVDFDLVLYDESRILYLWLAVLIMFTVVILGTYLLIQDFQKEQQRGTLNFIRFSPQSSRQLLWGKLLGVPIALYIGVALVIPLHLFLGILGRIELWQSLAFYILLSLGIITFLHFALLLSTLYTTQGMSILGVLINIILLMTANAIPRDEAVTLFDWLKLLSPSTVLPFFLGYTSETSWYDYRIDPVPFGHGSIEAITWFNLPIGQSGVFFWIIMVLNFSFCIFWLDRAFAHKFQNPHLPFITKPESYILVGSLQVIWLGFLTQASSVQDEFILWFIYNTLLILFITTALLPSRQPLLDWSRYRHESLHRKNGLLDLATGRNSPINLTILINLMIVGFGILSFALFWHSLKGWSAFDELMSYDYHVVLTLFFLIAFYVALGWQCAIAFGWKPEFTLIFISASTLVLSHVVYNTFSMVTVVIASLTLVIINNIFMERLRALGKSETKVLMGEK